MVDAVVVAEVWRSGVLEGVHRGHAVVVDADGAVQRSWGDPGVRILPRSANKPAQASAMVRAGLPLEDQLLALAAASHSGEAFHVEGVRRILAHGGLDDSALRTPADFPLDDDVRAELIARGGVALPILMNCSGKHAAMLLTCVVCDWSTDDYTSPDHPLQMACRRELEELAGEASWAEAVDGCGAPLFGLSLAGLARMGSACVQAEQGTPPRRVADAMRAHPEWVAGTSRDATALARSLPGTLVKEGAEAVYVAALPDGRGIALKVEDGANRARPVAMAGVLRALGIDNDVIEGHAHAPLMGGGRVVGEIRPGALT